MKIELVVEIPEQDIDRLRRFIGREATSAEVRRFLREEIGQSLRELRDQYP